MAELATASASASIVRPWLRALGRDDPPAELCVAEHMFRLERVFKHDFFAATALYARDTEKIIVKFGRQASAFGLPLNWIGRRLVEHEARLYALTQSIPGVPRFLGTLRSSALIHEFVEGAPLSRHAAVDDAFFPRLAAI